MPKKKRTETPAEQSRRFVDDAQKMINAGELNLTEADAAFDKLMKNVKIPKAN